MQVVFSCEECGAHGKVVFKETDTYNKCDVVYCPFCSADITVPIDLDEEDES